MLIPTSLFEHFIVFACLSIFLRFFYGVLISVRLLLIPRRTPLFTTLLVPSLILGYCRTVSKYVRPTKIPIPQEAKRYINSILGNNGMDLDIHKKSKISRYISNTLLPFPTHPK